MQLSGQDLRAGMTGDEVAELHVELARLGFTVPDRERHAKRFGAATARAVAKFQKAHGLRDSAVVDAATAAALTEAVADSDQPPGPESDASSGISGRVYFDSGVPAGGIQLRAYRRGFGGRFQRLGQTSTGPDGRYRIRFDADGEPVSLELRAVQVHGNEVGEIALTNTAFAVAKGEVLNVVAPTSVRPLAAEHRRLSADVEPHLHGRRLGAARETDEQPDLTLLQETTGWDARLVALAASAEHVTEETGVPPAAAYAMLRAGFPTDPMGLAGVSVSAVDRAFTEAAKAGVVTLDKAERAAALDAFVSFARTARLAAVAPGTLASQGEMLATAGLDAAAAARFDEIYAANAHRGGDTGQLWQQAKAAGLPVEALQLTGKLGYLTRNNATLTKNLQQEVSNELGPALVAGQLYRPQAWVQKLTALAGGDGALAALVPPTFQGNTVEARVRAYAEDLARKVRLGYPTNVVAHKVATGELALPGADPVRAEVASFLNRAARLGLALGRTPVSAMINEHRDQLLDGVPDERVDAVTDGVKMLHRVYQITPSDRAMKALLDSGLRSAHDVTAMTYATFLRHHGSKFSTVDEARLVYAKAQQVSSVTFAVSGAAKQLNSFPEVFALTGTGDARELAKTELIKTFPTMEALFGSMDYCNCDHCRSVLSPAAYLVDLLHFLDPPADEWQAELTRWRTDHQARYPFADAQAWEDFKAQWDIDHPGDPLPDTTLSPYQVLTRRRPDLGQLPLTCENTNTALPYLDVVNEILEFYVAHGRLEPGAVRDTGAALSADLLAEPQYLIPKAYDILRAASYPLVVPFDLWLETVRRLLDHFDTPLWTVLDAFRSTDALYPAGSASYGQAAVAIERLGLSGAEYELLTDPDPGPQWHQRYGYPAAGQAQAQTELSNATNLARRLGVTYQELLDLVTTGFVNPRLSRVAALPKLGIGLSDVLRYQEAPGHAPFTPQERIAFEEALAPIGGPAAIGDLWDVDELGQMLVLANPIGDGSFEHTTLQYADGTPADPIAFLMLNYLVRLWRRLGWTLTDTDGALQVFLSTDPDPRTGGALGRAMASALLGLARLHALREHLAGDRAELLELWSDLTATRYAELFLVPGTPAINPVFDQPLGRYLEYLDGGSYRPYTWDPALPPWEPGPPSSGVVGNVGLVNHVGTVQAALQLSAADVALILADTGTTLEAAPLDLATVSRLHRYGVLARRLRLSVADLIALRQLSGLDPFAAPQPQPIATLAEDHAHTTVRFVEAVLAVRDGGLSVAEVDYLLRHRYDPAGPYLNAAAAPLALIRSIDAEIARIQTEHADPFDPTVVTDEELRQKMALVMTADAVETFFGMWTATITYEAVMDNVDEADQLDSAAVATEPAVTLTYDSVARQQHLSYRGALVDDEKKRLVNAYPDRGPARDLYRTLLDSVQQPAVDFFNVNLVEIEPIGFLDAADYDEFFTPPPGDEDARRLLVDAFYPYLRDRLIDQVVLSTVGAEFPDAPELVAALLAEKELVADREWAEEALLAAYRAAGDRGVTELTDDDQQTASVDAYLEVATAGVYRFFVSCDRAGTVVDLRFDHLIDALLLATTAAAGEERSEAVELGPGTMYHLRLDATETQGGAVTLKVQGPNLTKGGLDRLTTHPADSVDRVRRAHVLLDKAVRLTAAVELTEPELRHLVTHPADFDGLRLGALPVIETEDIPASATTLFGQLRRLLDYATLRRDIAAAPAELTELFAQARRTYPTDLGPENAAAELLADMHARVAVLTRRDTATVVDAADRLGVAARARDDGDLISAITPALVNEVGLSRLWTVLALAGRLGVTPGVLATVATPRPDDTIARSLRDAVRACYDVAAWRRVAQPIFDKLRQRRRDALVAWVMHTHGFDRVEQLFEFFLVDPGTEPVVQTSRLRLAISAVQLFIQRCLLNLEPGVHPSVITVEHWQWMKRYRVWEANRKIFLWPENWLEPEFRDDKTHLFQALESSLFESDVTEDRAEDALYRYLRSLETLARLDIRALYVEEKDEPSANTLHVVGRTFGAPHAYFYRSYTYGMWTPWIPVTVEIESDHMVAAVWRERLHLFWVTFLEKADSLPIGGSVEDLAGQVTNTLVPPRRIEAHLHWTEYYQGEWADPVSGGLDEPLVKTVSPDWWAGREQIHVSHDGDAVLVHLYGGEIAQAFRLESKNSPPVPDAVLMPPGTPSPYWNPAYYPLIVMYEDRIVDGNVEDSDAAQGLTMEHILDDTGDGAVLRVAGNPLSAVDPDIAKLVSPLFYQDDYHTFHVEPTLAETTIDEYDGWAIQPVTPQLEFGLDSYWDRLDLFGQVRMATEPVPDDPIASVAKYQIQSGADWATQPGAAVVYDGAVVVGRSTTVNTAAHTTAVSTNGGRVRGRGRRPASRTDGP